MSEIGSFLAQPQRRVWGGMLPFARPPPTQGFATRHLDLLRQQCPPLPAHPATANHHSDVDAQPMLKTRTGFGLNEL